MAMTAPHVKEIGYVAPSYGPTNTWWMYEGESTPELMWPQSVEVYDAMRKQDNQVGSVLEAVTRPILRTPWRLDPAGARDEVVEFVADDLGLPIVGRNPKPPLRTKDRFSWLEHLELAMLMLPFGHIYFEVTYRPTEDAERAHLRKLSPRMPRTIERIDVARDGGLVSITQLGTMDQRGPQRPIPVRHLVAYVYKREGGNWLGRSILRGGYKNWLIKDRLLRVQAQTIERNGMGIPTYTAAENEPDLAKGLALATSLRSGEAAGAALPNGAELHLLGVEGTLPDALPAIKYHDEQIARGVLAHFLNLDTQSHGSYALGTTFADFFTLSLQTLAQQIADTATMHIVEDLVDVNWGEEEPAPRIVFDEIGSRQAATAQAIKTLVDAGIIQPDDVLEESSRQQYGLPPKDPDTVRGQDQGFGDAFGGVAPSPAGGDVAREDLGDGEWVVAPTASPGPSGGGSAVYASSAGDIDVDDDDEPGQFDEVTEALAAALAAFAGEIQAAAGLDWNPALHPRDRKGQFRTVFARVMHALQMWSRGEGGDTPLRGQGFTRDNLRDVATKHFGLKVRRGTAKNPVTAEEIEKQLLDHVRDVVRGKRDAEKPSAKFTLQGKTHRDLDVAVYKDPQGRPALFRENDRGEQGSLVKRFDSLEALQAWARARDNDEPRLAEWARKEGGKSGPKGDDGLDDLHTGALADLAREHEMDVPYPPRESDRESILTKLRTAGVVAPADDEPDPSKPTGPRELAEADIRLLKSASTAGLRRRGSYSPSSAQHDGRLDDLRREGYIKAERGEGTFSLTDKGREALAEWARKEQGGKEPANTDLPPDDAPPLLRELTQRPMADLRRLAKMSGSASNSNDPVSLAHDIRASRIRAWMVPGEPNDSAAANADEELRRMLRKIDAAKPAKKEPAKKAAPAKKATPKPEPATLDSLRTLTDAEVIRDELDLRKVDELKPLLREAGLPVSGRKRDLVDRLTAHVGQQPETVRVHVANEISRMAELISGRPYDPVDTRNAPKLRKLAAGIQSGTLSDVEARDQLREIAKEYPRSVSGDNLNGWANTLDRLTDHHLAGKVGPRKPAKATTPDAPDLAGSRGLSSDPAVREVQVENRIRAAYVEALKAGDRGYNGRPAREDSSVPGVRLSAVRQRIGDDVPRAEVDEGLRRLSRQEGVGVGEDENQKTLTATDREAAVKIFGDTKTMLTIDRESRAPSPLPAPTAATNPADLTDAPWRAKMTPHQRQIETDIRAAYASLKGRTDLPSNDVLVGNPGMGQPFVDLRKAQRESGAVYLADLRDALGEKYNRHEIDDVLRTLGRGDGDPAFHVQPVNARQILMQRDRDSALSMGGTDSHYIRIDDIPAPTPAEAAGLAANTIRDLRALAKQRGISIPAGARKADIIALLGG